MTRAGALPRFGLIGTGVWARSVAIPAAARSDAVRFTSVFGRNAESVEPLAAAYRVNGHTDLATFFNDVDIVGIAVPPDIQPSLALAAAAAGKHLLLEKPIATDTVEAEEVVAALDVGHLASVVFFTQLLMPRQWRWIEEARSKGGWIGARIESFSRVLVDPDNPYFGTAAWRGGGGALWDIGPHAVAVLTTVLGKVTDVTAMTGPGDLTVIALRHDTAAVSTVMLCLDAPVPLIGETVFFGADGKSVLPTIADWNGEATVAYEFALASLAAAALGLHAPRLPDARFGAQVTKVLTAVGQSVATGRRISLF